MGLTIEGPNSESKMAHSCLLADKLNPNLPFVISPDQHCGKDRQIGDLIHLISATINYVNAPHKYLKSLRISGMLVSSNTRYCHK